ncbi:MAG: thymidine phosphorylase family protein, partial [archaeon]
SIAIIDKLTAEKLDAYVGDRLSLSFKGKKAICIIDIVSNYLHPKEISCSIDVLDFLKLKNGDVLQVSLAKEPISKEFISKKMFGKELTKKEIYAIIEDISTNSLTEAEVSYFILGVYSKGMNFRETLDLTEAMYKTGRVLNWGSKLKVVDKHCIGGIPGNRTTPIVVSICAAAGLTMPKTSSRAITSAAGTADTIATLARVDFPIADLKKIVAKTGACLAWGGSLGMAPADDKLIRIERLLDLDPESQLIASILSKKIAAGSRYVLIDIPCGDGAKVSKSEALKLKSKFESVCKHFKLKVKVMLTDGSQPIGNGMGPVLEMIDVLKVLKRDNSPLDLENKSLLLAGEILEMVGTVAKGKGKARAKEILDSGKAYKKFEEIISAQGKKNVVLKPAKFYKNIISSKSGKLKKINNHDINHIARLLGCPTDKSSGVYIYKHVNEKVIAKEKLLTLYSESDAKLKGALNYLKDHKTFVF